MSAQLNRLKIINVNRVALEKAYQDERENKEQGKEGLHFFVQSSLDVC